jgi:hypothetical protein
MDPTGELDLTGNPTIDVLANPGSRHHGGTSTAHFTPLGGPLFPHDPLPTDIKQQSLADCYLLAAVMAIVARPGGDRVVAGMLKEHQGRVVVRLYDTGGVARYVSIEKSIRRNEEKHNGGALWATMIEKAYAAAAFVENGKLPDGKPNAQPLRGYAKLDHGHPKDALKVLLGGKSDSTLISAGTFEGGEGAGNAAAMLLGMWSIDEMERLAQIPLEQLRTTVFGGDGHARDRFLQWRTVHVKKQWQVLLDAHGDIVDGKDKDRPVVRRRVMRLEDLTEFLRANGLAPEIASLVVAFAEKHHLLAGRRGTGIYSALMLKAFDRIKQKLSQNQPVTLSTTKFVSSVTSGKGKSGGEAIGKGLVGTHAYAVISVREETTSPFRKWIRIRNPWGDTGRSYVQASPDSNVLKSQAIKAGEFDLELSDLGKRFSKMDFGTGPIPILVDL